MISTTERRHGENARIACTIPVELTHDAGAPGFEADAVDLSAGGLSLRASNLPEVGAALHCRFETLPGGTQISGRGEVVWTKLSGERSGEFGLRFTQIAPEAQALISEMIAERVAHASAGGAREPRMATLEFESVEAPITAKLTRATGRDVVFEQPLDVLALGSGLVAHSDKNLGHGNILRVDLRMDGGTPMLALTVRFSEPQEDYGEYDWGEPDSGTHPRTREPELAAASLVPDSEVDTVPDLAAPLGVFEHHHAQPMAAAPDDSEDTVPDAVPQLASASDDSLTGSYRLAATPAPVHTATSQPGLVRLHHEHEYATPEDFEFRHEEPSVQEYDAISLEDPHASQPGGTYVGPVQRPAPDTDPRLTTEAEEDTWSHSVSDSDRKSALVRFLRIFAAIENALAIGLGFAQRAAQRAARAIAPHLRRRVMRRTAATTTLRGVGAGAAATATRPRRTAGGPIGAPIPKWTRGTGRLVLLATLMLGCGMLLVYALTPSASIEEIESHRTLEAELAGEAETSPSAVSDVETPAAVSGSDPASPSPTPRPQPAASKAPDGAKAAAALVSARAREKSAAISASAFGYKHVPKAQRFLLRMSAPVTSVHGKSNARGFNIVIPGALAVDPAAPIAAANKAVARARIMNRGTYAELSVQFVAGKSPAFRVSAQEAGLEVLITQ